MLIAANWKMHGSKSFVHDFLARFREQFVHADTVDCLLCPPAPYIDCLATALSASNIYYGAQNLHPQREGAFTGEISPTMLTDLGCRYVIIGHSERRTYFQETNEFIAEKLAAAQQVEITPILCVGETLAERDAGLTLSVIEQQLRIGLQHASTANIVVAYEPVWAIGTGMTASPEQAQEVHSHIRQYLQEMALFGATAPAIKIVYGGSVKAENASALFAQADIDGALIGGASLQPDELAAIYRSACVAVE